MVNLITCDSYFELFPVLTETLSTKSKDLSKRNLIFCEAKVSLMVERFICDAIGGTFNTDVYSFGKYLANKNPLKNVISKEGSAMAIKKILNTAPLKCLKSSKANLSESLYDLIIQLKSAKITPSQVQASAREVSLSGLKNKLTDIATVFSEYEKFLIDTGADDQSSILSYLPEVIENDEDIKSTDVYLVGYTGFTAQARSGIESLIKNARSFTAILTEGDNLQAFVNETADFIRNVAKDLNQPFIEKRINSEYTQEGKILVNNLFTPILKNRQGNPNDKVHTLVALNPTAEVERVAEVIKEKVLSGECRYRDITVAIPEEQSYGKMLTSAFETLSIPFFLDEKMSAVNHPLVTLITSYIDAKRKNLERNALSVFYKNPLFCEDKTLSDSFENYCIKYNVNFSRINQPFSLGSGEEKNFDKIEQMRERVCKLFEKFNVKEMLKTLSVEEKLEKLTEQLRALGEDEESSVNAQMYKGVTDILLQVDTYLSGTEMSLNEYKGVFLSGVTALKLSIIPQYNDAVFIGNYKQTALAKAKYLFAVGLTDAVPSIRQDVALLSDGDIDALEQIRVMVEPKIKVVNHRTRESVALALGAFEKGLYLSTSISGVDGKETIRSEVFIAAEKLFKPLSFPFGEKYLTLKQGKKNFAYTVGSFADGLVSDIQPAANFYKAVGEENLRSVLDSANKEIVKRLDMNGRELDIGETSPTTIEDYFKCPYRAFLSRTLKLCERDDGTVSPLSVGNLMHEILKGYVKDIDRVTDEETSNILFDEKKKVVLNSKEYAKFLSDAITGVTLSRALEECRKYCYKTYLSFKNSHFKVKEVETAFGEGKKIPAISLDGGKVKLKGKIDRVDVDEENKYFRILDYKTGSIDGKDQNLFYGQELQLYLYAAAVRQSELGKGKTPAGLYYLPISDKFMNEEDKLVPLAKGKTLEEKEAITAQDVGFFQKQVSEFLPVTIDQKSGALKDGMTAETIDGYVDYALKVSDLAAKRLCEGVIVPSPIKEACKYCDFKAMCDSVGVKERMIKKVGADTIVGALIAGGEEDGEIN